MIECERNALSLFPNPRIRKAGSSSSVKWKSSEENVKAILRGKGFDAREVLKRDIVDAGMLVAIRGITQYEDATVFSIYQSEMTLRVRPPFLDLKHDGGIVVYRFFVCNDETIKWMIRVLNIEGNRRDLNVSPHTAKRYHLPSASPNLKFVTMCEAFAEADVEETEEFKQLPQLLAGISALGCVDSSLSKYNQIIGMSDMSNVLQEELS
jgi:hypothetical protein